MKHYKVILTPRKASAELGGEEKKLLPQTWAGEAVCLLDALHLARRTVWPEHYCAQVVEE